MGECADGIVVRYPVDKCESAIADASSADNRLSDEVEASCSRSTTAAGGNDPAEAERLFAQVARVLAWMRRGEVLSTLRRGTRRWACVDAKTPIQHSVASAYPHELRRKHRTENAPTSRPCAVPIPFRGLPHAPASSCSCASARHRLRCASRGTPAVRCLLQAGPSSLAAIAPAAPSQEAVAPVHPPAPPCAHACCGAMLQRTPSETVDSEHGKGTHSTSSGRMAWRSV
jgi:hypothetical protein